MLCCKIIYAKRGWRLERGLVSASEDTMMNTGENNRARSTRPVAARKNALRATLIALVLLLCYTQIRSTAAQEAITGEWIIETKPGTDRVYLTVQHGGKGRHNHSMSSTDINQDYVQRIEPGFSPGQRVARSVSDSARSGNAELRRLVQTGQRLGPFHLRAQSEFRKPDDKPRLQQPYRREAVFDGRF